MAANFDLKPSPLDTITRVRFIESLPRNVLACTSWDRKLRIYDTDGMSLVASYESTHALLDCAFLSDQNRVVFCGLNKNVSTFDVNSSCANTLGKHDDPIRCLAYQNNTNLVYTGGWDRKIRVWDSRSHSMRAAGEALLHGKVFAMDITPDNSRLVVTDSLKRTYIYDIRGGPSGLQHTPEWRDQILKFQTRAVKCFPDNTGFAMSSIEGRVAWEFFSNDADAQARRYAFKCHRLKDDSGTETACPVNALAFHPKYGTFATGGSDRVVSCWDGNSKKRLWRLPPYATGISGLSFNHFGNQLAVAVSYSYDQGNMTPPIPSVSIRSIKDEDVRPKGR